MTSKPTTTNDAKLQCDMLPGAQNDKSSERVTPEQRALWQQYLEQQARRSCPGCGDDGDAVL